MSTPASSSAVSSANSSPPAERDSVHADIDYDDDSKDEYENVTIVEDFIPLPSAPQSTPPASSQPSSLASSGSASPSSTVPLTIVAEFIPQRRSQHTAPSLSASVSSSLPASQSISASASPALSSSIPSSYQPSAAVSPSSSPSPPTPLALSDDDDDDDNNGDNKDGVSFSTLASSISSLESAIQRLSARLEQPQPVYIITPNPAPIPAVTAAAVASAAPTTAGATTHNARPQPLHRTSRAPHHAFTDSTLSDTAVSSSDESMASPSPVKRVRRRHPPLPVRMYAVIDEQRRMMNEMMQALHVQPYDLPHNHHTSTHSSTDLPAATRRRRPILSSRSPPPTRGRSMLSAESDDDEHIEQVHESPPRRLSTQQNPNSRQPHTIRRSSATAQLPSDSPMSLIAPRHVTSSRQPRSPSSPPLPGHRQPAAATAAAVSSPLSVAAARRHRLHPPPSHALQAELDRMKRREQTWKARAKTTRTQQMREDAIDRKRQQHDDERRQRDEELEVEQRRRQLVEQAMVERWGVRGQTSAVLQAAGS